MQRFSGNAKPQEKNTYNDNSMDDDSIDEEINIQDPNPNQDPDQDPDQEKLVDLFKKLSSDDATADKTEKNMLDDLEVQIQEHRKKLDAVATEITPLRRKINQLEVKRYNELQIVRSLMRQQLQVHRNAKRKSQILFLRERLIQKQLIAQNRKSLMDIKNTHIDGECDTIKKNGTKCSRYSNYGFSKKAKISICKYVFFFLLLFIMFY